MADVNRIFALGAQNQAQTLTWRDFEGDFSETTFMDQVTKSAMLKEPSADWDGNLDIKRIRNVLDTAKSQITRLRSEVNTMIKDQGEICKQAEQILQTDCDHLMNVLHGLEDSYSTVNDKYITVSSSSVAVGQTLKSLFSQKERAEKTRRLLANFLKFQESENHMQEMLLSNEQLLEGSTALQEVVVLCEGLDKEEYGVIIDRVNNRVQSVVNKLIESLQEATMTNDLQQLALITSCLSTFQKGMGVYQTYTHISLERIKRELSTVQLEPERMFDDFVVYVIQYWQKLTDLYNAEINTVYEIFEKDAVCQVMVTLVDRVFGDQTIGIQFLLQIINGCPSLSKEEKFELLVKIRECSNKFFDDMISSISEKEKHLVGHAERIIREKEGLEEALNGAFAANMDQYFSEELSVLNVAFKEIIASNMGINITSASSKSEIRSQLKQTYGDLDAIEMTKQFITTSLSPITILDIFNTATRTLNRLQRMRANDGRVSSVAKVVFDVITNYILVIHIRTSNI